MPAIANLVLNDAQATPVAHTFKPVQFDAKTQTWWFEDQNTSVDPSGWNRISISVSKPSMAGVRQSSDERNVRVVIKVYQPKLETMGTADSGITPPSTVAYICRTHVEFVLPERSTLQFRKDARKYLSELLANANVQSLIDNCEAFF